MVHESTRRHKGREKQGEEEEAHGCDKEGNDISFSRDVAEAEVFFKASQDDLDNKYL